MTRIAIISDLHFGVKSDSLIFLEHQKDFFEKIFFPYCDENNIKTVINMGDTFDRRKYINYVTLKRSKDFFFSEIQKRNIEYHMVLGNHDVFYTNTNEINSVKLLLSDYPNFRIYENDPVELTFGSTKILLCPWITKTNSEASVKAISDSSANYVMGHFEIKGFEMMKGSVCEHGLDKDFFSKFEGVYSGHFHHPSEYGNIKYLGAQYEMNWSDYGSKRGFHIFDTEKRSLAFIENTRHVFHKIIYDDLELKAEDIQELDVSALENTYIKLIVKNKTNPYIFDLFLNRLVDSGAADVKTVEESFILGIDGSEDNIDETKNTQEILHDYINSIETTIPKQKIKSVIDILYVEASNQR